MSKFFRFLLMVTAGLHLPFAFAFYGIVSSRAAAPVAYGATALAVLLGIGLAPGRIRGGLYDAHRSRWITEGIDAPYYVHWCACVFLVVPFVLVSIGAPLLDLARGEPLAVPLRAYASLYVAGLGVGFYGVMVRRRVYRVARLDVHLENLPAAFDGYRVAHLSDLHIGAMTPKRRAQRWVEAANREAPDLAVVTGDMVTNGVDFHEDIAETLGGLRAKDGAVVSMGNHDYFGEGEPLMSLLGERGVRVMRNVGEALRRGDALLYLAAIDDVWTRRADMEKALADRPAGATTVLLAHDPRTFPEAAARGVDLVLSGHTHAGQVAMPFLGRRLSFSHLAHAFHVGFYRHGRSTLYVHPGLGTTGPPIRLGTVPTVAILTLRRGKPKE